MTYLHYLEPCPFCGGKAEMVREGTSRHSCQVACEDCGATQEGVDESCWNSRVDQSRWVSMETGRHRLITARPNDLLVWDCCKANVEIPEHTCQ